MRMRGDINIYRFLRHLKHGYRILSLEKWISLSQFHIFAGVLGVTGLILAIKDGKIGSLRGLPLNSESGDSSEKLFLVPGLRNLGNNCFLNVILQALASCDCFHHFLQNIIERNGFSIDDQGESMPLTVALFALYKEMCKPCDGRMILSPRRVMLAMDQYIPSFNLTRQQDAAEAFLHILSSLKEETSECYVPNYGSLAEIFSLSQRKISNPIKREGLNEQERWQKDFLGPFNGILGSSLTCKSCSSQLSTDFEYLLSLPLSPLCDGSETIINGCSVEHCLKQFTAAERIDNYRCNQCWHIAAIKYFATVKGHESQIERLNSCVGEDSCDCRNLFPRGVPWSNNISCTLKQLSIARCPKILCLHLQRASVNEFGELVKLQGHISFPMLLDLFPFTKPVVGVGKGNFSKNVERMLVDQPQPPITRLDHFNMPFATHVLQQIYGRTGQNINIVSEPLVEGEVSDECTQALKAREIINITSEPLVGVKVHTNDSAGDCAQALQPGEINLVPEPLVRVEVGDTNDSTGDKCAQAFKPGLNINITSEPFVGVEVGDTNDSGVDKCTQALKPGENIDFTSESVVGFEVGNTNDSAVEKCTQALKTGEDINITLEPLVGVEVDDINDSGSGWDECDQAMKPGNNINIMSESLVEVEVDGNDSAGDKCAQALKPGENVRTMSEPFSGVVVGDINDSAGDKSVQALESVGHSEGRRSYPKFGSILQSEHKNNNSRHLVASKSYMYGLVSVVEHFGRVGSGHYTVYRRVTKSDDSNSVERLSRAHVRWFCISDSDVLHVSEKDVLAADASLLFYERI